jgi:hypothetical protein
MNQVCYRYIKLIKNYATKFASKIILRVLMAEDLYGFVAREHRFIHQEISPDPGPGTLVNQRILYPGRAINSFGSYQLNSMMEQLMIEFPPNSVIYQAIQDCINDSRLARANRADILWDALTVLERVR